MTVFLRGISLLFVMTVLALCVLSCSAPTPPNVAIAPEEEQHPANPELPSASPPPVEMTAQPSSQESFRSAPPTSETGELELLDEADYPSESEALEQPISREIIAPQRLGIYYGWPSAALSIDESIIVPEDLFSQFSVVVFGETLAEPEHPDHTKTLDLIDVLTQQGVEVYGYIDMGMTTRPGASSMADLASEIERWLDAGATGIFWDDAGYEYTEGLSYLAYRQRLAELIERTHAAGLKVFLNAWNSDDLFRTTVAGGEEPPNLLITEDDLVLAESWFVSDGRLEEPMQWYERAEKLAGYRDARPFRLACVSTGDDRGELAESGLFQAAYWAAVMEQCDLFQYTNPHYSATGTAEGNHLLVTPLPAIPVDTSFSGGVQVHSIGDFTEFVRPTDSGEVAVGSDGDARGYGGFRPGDQTP